jgi:hypothetical protein
MAAPPSPPEVRRMLQNSDTAAMRGLCETFHPAKVAESLMGSPPKRCGSSCPMRMSGRKLASSSTRRSCGRPGWPMARGSSRWPG